MRIVFHLPYRAYHRLYGSTVQELAGRGHTVLLSYDSEKQSSAGALGVEQTPGVEVVAPIPRRSEPLADVVTRLRTGADYLRYLDPRFAEAPWLRERMTEHLPKGLRFLSSAPEFSSAQADVTMRLLREIELAIPSDPGIDACLSGLQPDCVMVSPVLARGRSGVHQRDSVKSARALGIPVGVGVASWDHLTSKGVIGERPDALYVWNAAQREEAVTLHGIEPERVVLTGAPAFDHWFGRSPQLSGPDFARSVGLDGDRRFLLWVGSSPNISPVERESAVVRRWVRALRERAEPELSGAGVLVRPHPGNVADWAAVDLADLPGVVVAPRSRPDTVMTEADEQLYFHSLHHSCAVVGVNTSAMVEAAIAGRPVHAFAAAEFRDTQAGTLHFRLLTPEAGGCVRVAADLDEHFGQLVVAIREPEALHPRIEAFVQAFVRPCGLDTPATVVLADAVERLGGFGA